MSEIAKRLGLTEEQLRYAIKKGAFSCSISFYDEVIYHYRQSGSMQKTADHFNIPKSQVWTIVHKYE